MGFAYGTGITIIIAVLLLKFAEGLNKVVLEDEINQNIKSDNRTTVLSICSLSQVLFRAILVFVFGIVADLVGVQLMFVYVVKLNYSIVTKSTIVTLVGQVLLNLYLII